MTIWKKYITIRWIFHERMNWPMIIVISVRRQVATSNACPRAISTNTRDGAGNFVSHLIAPLTYRYYLTGRAGTGKSVFMKKVAEACMNHGLDIELYHCSFDPNSVDM